MPKEHNKKILNCIGCKKNFELTNQQVYGLKVAHQKNAFCSRKCRAKYYSGNREITCFNCRIKFEGKGPKRKYCNSCRKKLSYKIHNKKLKNCLGCDKEFLDFPSGNRKYCNRSCYLKNRPMNWNKGLTKETDERIKRYSEKIKGGKNHMYGKKPWNYGLSVDTNELVKRIAESKKGKKRDKKTIEAMGPTMFKREDFLGAKNPRWKGGITPLRNSIRKCKQYISWRDKVFTRDNYTCKKCGKQGTLHAHHKISFEYILRKNKIKELKKAMKCNELWDVSNGVTLCKNHHIQVHRGDILV